MGAVPAVQSQLQPPTYTQHVAMSPPLFPHPAVHIREGMCTHTRVPGPSLQWCINVCFHFFQRYRTAAPTDLISEALTVSTPQASAPWILLATTSPATKQERGSSGDLPASYRDLLLACACTQLPTELSCFWGCQLGTGTRPQHSCAPTSC